MTHLMLWLRISWVCWNPLICDNMFIATPTELGHTLAISRNAESILNVTSVDDSSVISAGIITLSVLIFNLLSLAGKGNVSVLESLKPSILSINKNLDCLLFYLIPLVTYLGFSTCITQHYPAYLINMHHLNRAWLPSALLLNGSVRRLNWREEFVVDWKGIGEGVDYLKTAYVSLSLTGLLSLIYTSKFSLTSPLVKENLPIVHTSKFSLKRFSLTSFPW